MAYTYYYEVPVDCDIPIPPKIPNANATKYPWVDMEIGDSFVYAGKLQSLRSIISYQRKKTGHDYVYQVIEDTGNPSDIRVWRVA